MATYSFINEISCGDCLEILPKLDDNSIDLVVTSPPYNVDLGNNKYNKKGYDIYRDNLGHKEYINWLRTVFDIVYNKLKTGGRCVINVGDGKNGVVPTHSDIIQFMTKDIGYLQMAAIIWQKSNVSNRTSWGSWLSPSSPSFPTPFEYILVFASCSRKLQDKGETDLTKEEFIEWSLAKWEFPGVSKKKSKHPASFPPELPKRCIKMLSWRNAIVLDPFCGVGTTCIEAKKLGRKYIGFDISEEYCNIARKNLEEDSL